MQGSQKAMRFFKERKIPYHFRDLTEKGLSGGELENIKRNVKPEELTNTDSKRYKEKGMGYRIFNIEEELLNDTVLIKTPIVRNGNNSTIGYTPEIWLEWLK